MLLFLSGVFLALALQPMEARRFCCSHGHWRWLFTSGQFLFPACQSPDTGYLLRYCGLLVAAVYWGVAGAVRQ